MKKGKIIGLWILSIFFMLSAMVYFPSFSSLISVLIVALVIPIAKWQAILNKYIKGKLKLIIVIVLALVTIFTAPNTEVNAPDDITPTITTGSTTDFTVGSTSDPTTASTTESTTTPTTEPTTAPTTEPTTAPTTEPTTAPTTEPTTAPTTEPTTAPTTEPTTAPTTAPTTEPPHTHNFSVATCTAPKTCSCGVTEGNANGHSWKDATCTSPKVCTACGETIGSAANHNYSNGNCSVCGAKDPSYVSEAMVWIPTHGGTKYHSKSSCSKMIDPIQVTKSNAISQGFGPCGKCY